MVFRVGVHIPLSLQWRGVGENISHVDIAFKNKSYVKHNLYNSSHSHSTAEFSQARYMCGTIHA